MRNLILGLLAETFIHSGVGRTEGAIDLPVAREAATDYPYIPGSSLKGALRDYAGDYWKNGDASKVETCFGKEGAEQAGGVLVSDARLLLLPVRSLTGSYKWVTCPMLLERLKRDFERMNSSHSILGVSTPEEGRFLGKDEGILYLEERNFSSQDDLPENLVEQFGRFIRHVDTQARLPDQLVILHNKDFNWFARYALSVQARNVLDENKKSKNLWYEESLPPDTLMYALLGKRCDNSGIANLKTLLQDKPYLQTGGNETVGMGWFAMQAINGGGNGQ
ncbi:MAG: type III-B CRISPR module RAMP protein Cmr4 [gamma proteobacterium symbiont of Ctena orbiculata]|nr:MAG: type III-B CRISPR module RAMP protein Cmr4 [gamma proteobacterium symbiont of Ctena orbiculata]